MADFIAIDFETANQSRNSACAVGVTVVENGKVSESFSRLIRPPTSQFSKFNSKIHRLNETDILAAPNFSEVWSDISTGLEDQIVVAHNAAFDFTVLVDSLDHYCLRHPNLRIACSQQISQLVWPEFNQHTLGFLAHWLDVPLNHHEAGSDSKASAELVLHAMKSLKVANIIDLLSILDVRLGYIDTNKVLRWPDGPSRPNRDKKKLSIPTDLCKNHPCCGLRVVITGDLPTISKNEAFQLIEAVGAIKEDNVTKKTAILVNGYNDPKILAEGETESTNLRKARKRLAQGFSIAIITPEEFMQKFLFEVERESAQPVNDIGEEQIEFPVVDLNQVDSAEKGIISWLTRTFEEHERWKKLAKLEFFAVGGDHELARARTAVMIRSYFLDLDLPNEVVQNWSEDGSKVEQKKIIPPSVTGPRLQFINWALVADYLLLCCAVVSVELETQNTLRSAEHRFILQNYQVLIGVNAARTILRSRPLLSNEDALELLKKDDSSTTIAQVKEARRREEARIQMVDPIKPNEPVLIKPYKPIYF